MIAGPRRATMIAAALTLVSAVFANAFVPSQIAAAAHATSPFGDVDPSSPFVDDIQWMVDSGITAGYPDGGFHPSSSVTRQAFAAFLYRFDGGTAGGPCVSGASQFVDVPDDAQFCSEIAWLAQRGISTGYSDGTFRPGIAISRQAIAAFLYRYDHTLDDRTGSPGTCISDRPFPDIETSSLFCESIRWLSEIGPTAITTGYDDGTFRATTNASRQAIAAWLHRYRADAPEAQSDVDYIVADTTVEVASSVVLSMETTEQSVPDANEDGVPDTSTSSTTVVELTAPAPEIGEGFVVSPDSSTAGIAGRVTDVVDNGDGTSSVTLESAALDQIFDSLTVLYDGPVDLDAATASRSSLSMSPTALARRSSPQDFPETGAASSGGNGGLFNCKNESGATVVPDPSSISFNMAFENVRGHFELRVGLFVEPYIDVWLSMEPVFSFKVELISVGITCKVNALPKLGPLSIVGPLTVSLSPYIEFSLGGSASLEFSQRFYRTAGIVTNPDGGVSPVSNSANAPAEVSLSGEITATFTFGINVEIGVLDRVGIVIRVGPKVEAKGEAKISGGGETSLCLKLTISLSGSIGAYLDVFVDRWTWTFGEASISLPPWEKCFSSSALPPGSTPIISAVVPTPIPLSGGLGNISGARLAGTLGIVVDGVTAPFTGVSDTSMTIVLPPMPAGTHTLELRAASGITSKTVTYAAPVSIHDVAVGAFPNEMAIDPVTRRLYVANANAASMSIVDLQTSTVLSTVALGGNPGGIAIDPVTHDVFVSSTGNNTVKVVDGYTGAIITSITVNTLPIELAVDATQRRVFVTSLNTNSISVISIDSLTKTGTVNIGGPSARIVSDPGVQAVYVSLDTPNVGNLVRVNTSTLAVDWSMPLGLGGAREMGVDLATHTLYVAATFNESGATVGRTVSLNPSGTQTASAVIAGAQALFVTPDGRLLVAVTEFGTDGSLAIYSRTLTALGTQAAGQFSVGVTYDPVTGTAYVANAMDNSVSAISIGTG